MREKGLALKEILERKPNRKRMASKVHRHLPERHSAVIKTPTLCNEFEAVRKEGDEEAEQGATPLHSRDAQKCCNLLKTQDGSPQQGATLLAFERM